MIQRIRRVSLTTIVALAVTLVGCQTNQAHLDPQLADSARNANDLLVVDCALPSRIRRIGQNMTFLEPRRALRTSAVDCEIRGGEYVAYDRADYATSLRIWLPLAKAGDADAQVYVGEIYEKGLGVTADYELAAAWYRKAAALTSTRAMINLGYLYESGLGVERDLTTAMNWYRQASGLSNGNLEFVSSVELADRRAATAELQGLRAETQQLRRQLETAETKLSVDRKSLAATRRTAEKLRRELSTTSTVPDGTVSAARQPDPALQKELEVAQSERRRLLADLARSDSEAAGLRSQLDERRVTLERRREQLQRAEQDLAATRQQLASVRSGPARPAQSATTDKLQREVQESQQSLQRQRSEIVRLTRDLSATQIENKRLDADLQARTDEVEAMQARLADGLAGKAGPAGLREQLNTSQQDRMRLLQQLTDVQLQLAEIQQTSQQTENVLTEREQQLTESETALSQLRNALASTRANSNASASMVSALQSAVAERERNLETARGQVASLSRQLQVQTNKAEKSVLAVRQREQSLARALADRDRQIESLQAELTTALQATTELRTAQERLASADSERARLASQLATQQVAARKLKDELTIAQSSAELRKNQLESHREALALLQRQVDESESALNTKEAQTKALETRLAEQSQQLAEKRKELETLEADHQRDRAKLEYSLADAQREKTSLEVAAAEQQQTVASMEAELSTTRESLVASKRRTAELEDVEKKLDAENSKVAKLEQQVQQLRKKVSANKQRPEGPTISKVVVTEETGPVIEIIEPPLAATRSIPSVLMRSAARTVELIGRVRPEDHLLSFKINENPSLLEDNGIFRKLLKVKSPNTPVNIVAVDDTGKRTALDFMIVPPAERAIAAGSAPQSKPQTSRTAVQRNIDFGNYHALIIGNQSYEHLPNLKTPQNDARELDSVLRTRYGFETTLLIDASRYQILSALNDLRATLTEKDNLVVFYAGHGELDSVNLRGHWLPVDAEPENSANWVSNVAITDVLNAMAAKHILVIADSCYSGAMTRSSVARLESGISSETKAKWYRIMAKARTRAVLTSGGLQPVLDSGGGNHSIFTAALLKVLRANNEILEGYKLYRSVQTKVKSQAARLNVDQDPQYAPIKFAGHEAGEFFFLPKARAALNNQLGIDPNRKLAGM